MINICYSGNYKIFDCLALSILSVLKSTEEELNFIILTMDLSDENSDYKSISEEEIEKLRRIIQEKNSNNIITRIDVTDFYKASLRHGKNHKTMYTPFSMIRLFIPKIENMPDKIIYLDTDTMVYNNIKILYDIDINDYEYAASLDYMGRFWKNPKYINSGVLLLNIKKIKETGLFDKVINMILTKKMMFPDQDALNRLAIGKYIIEDKFNEQRSVKQDTVVKHFCKGVRWFPFKMYNIKQNNIDKVHTYLKITEFDDVYKEYNELKLSNKL